MTDIKLAPLTEHDLEMIRVWRNTEDVAKYMYTDNEITKEQQIAWYDRVKNDPSCRYWIISYDEKQIGLVSLSNISKLYDSCSWAFYLGDQSIRGAGIGSKVEYNVIEIVFEELKLNKLNCEVLSSNEKVVQMHEKFGFRREAFYRQHVNKNGNRLDVVGLALLRSDWQLIKDSIHTSIYNR